MNDELSQWCEIYGHEWVEFNYLHGLVGRTQTWGIIKTCRLCKTEEHKIWVSK